MAGFFYTLMFTGLGVVVVCLLDPFGWFSGKDKRRAVVTAAPEAATPAPLPCENCGHLPGMPTTAELAESDRSDPAPRMAMPAGIGAGSSVRAAETVRDGFLDSIARPGEEQMLAGLKAMQNAPLKAAAPEAVTETLPAVTAVAPLWKVTAGPGSTKPEELSPTAGRLATTRVADALEEAS